MTNLQFWRRLSYIFIGASALLAFADWYNDRPSLAGFMWASLYLWQVYVRDRFFDQVAREMEKHK